MSRNEPHTNPEVTLQRIPDQPKRPKWKKALALALGFLALCLGIILGEVFGDFAMFIGLAPYFLLSQYMLSRSNPQAAGIAAALLAMVPWASAQTSPVFGLQLYAGLTATGAVGTVYRIK